MPENQEFCSTNTVKIVAVVVTMDRPVVAAACLRSLQQAVVRPDTIVVVDNGSKVPFDPTAQSLSSVVVVRLEHNSGPAGGAAAGQRKALELGADWVWMVDDDAVAEPDALASLVESLPGPEERVFLRSVCYEMDHSGLPFYNAFFYNRTTGLLWPVPREAYRDRRFRFDACGMAGLLVSGTLLREIGPFDASLFGWYDDTEFTLRATSSGFVGYGIPASRLLHPSANRRRVRFLGRSLSVLVQQPERLYYGTRNCICTQRRMLGRVNFWLLFTPLFLIRRFLSIVLLYNNRRVFLHYFSRGVRDGLRGRTGELSSGGLSS